MLPKIKNNNDHVEYDKYDKNVINVIFRTPDKIDVVFIQIVNDFAKILTSTSLPVRNWGEYLYAYKRACNFVEEYNIKDND